MPSFSIDLAAERIVEKRSQSYFEEVLRSFANGCYRSSLVMLWTVVVCDLVYKLQALRDMHGDPQADKLLKEVEAKQAAAPTNPDWEVFLLDEVAKRTKLLEASEHTQLQALQKLRHLSAHPFLTGADLLFHPSREMARAHIRMALEAVLLKPPLFSKRIITALVEDIAANEALLISKATLKSYLDARYFPNLPPAVELELFRALWKFCFKLRNPDTDAHRRINTTALGVVYDRNPAVIRAAIDSDRAYFSDVGPDAELLTALFGFLVDYPALYSSLNSAATILIDGQIATNINLRLRAAFRHTDFAAHIVALQAEGADVFDAVEADCWASFLDRSADEGLLQEACDIAIRNYGASASYDDADKRFTSFIAPVVERIDATRIVKLLEAIDANSQTYDRRRARNHHRMIEAAATTHSVDMTPFSNFMASI